MSRPALFHRLFIANRGEVAARIARTCDEMGVTPVFGVSEADADAPYVKGREVVVLGPSRPALSYLDPLRLVQAARQSRCSALHPGWGFLAESPRLASLVESHGITFIGPPAHVMHRMGQKIPAKHAMHAAGLRLIEGSEGVLADAEEALEVARSVGFPVLLKALSGGGGRGMRVARDESEIGPAFTEASAEARGAFGDARLFLEKLIEGGRHIEIQVLADRYGKAVHLGERDCTIQRNHQKLIEESPSPSFGAGAGELERALEAAVHAVEEIGYVGAGTMEFLLDESGELRFMEMNTRLQVEHCVSEMRSGIDLVEQQIRVAAGQPLSFSQSDITLKGHAIECRINAEDPSDGFRPTPGVIETLKLPSQVPGRVRVDTHVVEGDRVSPHYDSLICKVITRGDERAAATETMIGALSALRCEGVSTTIPMHLQILRSAAFADNDYDTRTIPGFEL